MSRIPRVFVDQAVAGGSLRLAADAAAHLVRVLRLRPGADVVLFDGSGTEYPGRVRAATRRSVDIDVGPGTSTDRESPLVLTLLQGVCRAERMDFVVRKATELGVAAIRPVLAGRSVVRLDAERAARRLAHWRAIVVSACEQCGRSYLPELLEPLPLAEALAAHAGAVGVLLDPDAATGADALAPPGAAPLALLVGPEGGLTQAERAVARAAGFTGIRLGPRILRTETAALVGIALLQARFGDLC